MKIERGTVYFCRTKELAEQFMEECKKLTGKSFREFNTYWDFYNIFGESTCFLLKPDGSLTFNDLESCKRNNDKIIEYTGIPEDIGPNIKDKIIEIAKQSIIENADCSEISDDIITLDECSFNSACSVIADRIIFQLPEILETEAHNKYKKQILILETALKRLISEYTHYGMVTMEGCEDCASCDKSIWECLQTQFKNALSQVEEGLKNYARREGEDW